MTLTLTTIQPCITSCHHDKIDCSKSYYELRFYDLRFTITSNPSCTWYVVGKLISYSIILCSNSIAKVVEHILFVRGFLCSYVKLVC